MKDDRIFYQKNGPYSLGEIAKILEISVDEQWQDLKITDVKPLAEAGKTDISFLINVKYVSEYKATKAGICIVPIDFEESNDNKTVLIKAKNPYYLYAKVVDLFYQEIEPKREISGSAQISTSAKIGKNCYIGHNVVIGDEVEIGDNAYIEAGSFIGYKVKIGNNAKIYSSVSIANTIIGDDVLILPGARIGQDGFGFATEAGKHKKIYHIGRVIIGNDVEIGANSTIDRGSMNDTVIEDFCRIDNLVQIGHNVHIAKGSIIVAQVGIAGSSKIGAYCALGGQVGIAGHITVADQVQIAGQGGVIQNITESGIYGGTPAVPIRDWHRQSVYLRKLIKDRK